MEELGKPIYLPRSQKDIQAIKNFEEKMKEVDLEWKKSSYQPDKTKYTFSKN